MEERSAEAALNVILPKILSANIDFECRVYDGKHDLLKKLPARLRGYRQWLPDDQRIVVLIDEDRQDCKQLKEQLEQLALSAGFMTKSNTVSKCDFQVVNRLAIEELEAWFFGDPIAVRKAYPRVPRTFEHQAKYRNPDAIRGGTSEALQFLLKGYYTDKLPKIEVAQKIAQHMDPNRNRSKSFQVFVEGLKACVGESEFII